MVQPPPPEPSVYYGGKTGAVADIANHVLTGWMAGKYMGEQKAREKAAQSIGTMKDAVDSAGQAYRAAVEGGDQKKIEAAGRVLDQQWGEYNTAREHYVMPPDLGKDGKKKGVGEKVKGGLKAMFSPQHPQLYLQAAINASKQIDPKQLYGPSKQEQQQSKLTDLQVQGAEQAVTEQKKQTDSRDKWETILQKPEKERTAEDNRYVNFYEHEKFGKTKEDFLKDQIIDSVSNGKPLTPEQHTFAEKMGLVKPAVVSTQLHTTMGPKGMPQTELVAIGPDGKMVGAPQKLPGVDYVPPDQAQMAGRVIDAETSAYARMLAKAHPEWDEQTRYSVALGQVAHGTTMDWAMKNQQMDVMNRALLKMLNAHTKTYKDKEGNPVREYDDIGNALVSHFITSSDDGRYTWNAKLGEKSEPGWWGKLWGDKESYGPYSKDQLQQYDRNSRAELRAILKEQNKSLTDSQVDQMMPASGWGDQKQGQPGAQGGAPKAAGMEPPPQGPGGQMKSYTVQTGAGPVQRDMSDEQADALRSQGVQVAPAMRNPKLSAVPQ